VLRLRVEEKQIEGLLAEETTDLFVENFEISSKFAKKGFLFRWTAHEQNNKELFKNPDLIIKKFIAIIEGSTGYKKVPNKIKKLVFQLERGSFLIKLKDFIICNLTTSTSTRSLYHL
jgi:hypothetical protein